MKLVNVEIKGITPLLIHRFSEQAEQSGATRTTEVGRRVPRDEAEKVLYKAPDGTFYFSSASISRSMGNAGANHKMRGTRKSLRFVVPSAVCVLIDGITILNGAGPAKPWEVDARPVTIPSTKGRVMRYRPRFDVWRAEFQLQINDEMLSLDTAHTLLNEAGMSFGVGDFRPEKGGPFGRFHVTKWEEHKD